MVLGQLLDDSDVPWEDRPLFTKLSEYFTTLTKESISKCPVLPPLRFVKRNTLMWTVDCVNNLCQFISTSTLRATADLLYAAAKVETVGVYVREILQNQMEAFLLGKLGCNVNLTQCARI